MGRRCKATKEDGSPCWSYAITGQPTCYFHTPPHLRPAKKTAEPPPAPESMADAASYLAWICEQTATGNLDDTTARTLVATMNTYMKAHREAVKEEKLVEKMKSLEEQIKQLQRARQAIQHKE